jgi:hypothetical protein
VELGRDGPILHCAYSLAVADAFGSRRNELQGPIALHASDERAASPRSHRDDRPLSRAAHGVFSESANAAHWLGGFVATPPEDKTAPRAFPSERSGVGHGDYLIRTFLLRAVAAFGTWTVKIPS